jgi:hypothetical protein
VRLTPLKARIFDLIQRGGDDGITCADLFDIVFGDGKHSRETQSRTKAIGSQTAVPATDW